MHSDGKGHKAIAPANCGYRVTSSAVHVTARLLHEAQPMNHLPITPIHSPTMSHNHPASAPPSNFQLIFNNALKIYEKRTKCDLVAHPLAAQLQACESPTAILATIHQQVQGLGQTQRADERMTKWLNPTINVLYALSTTLGQGVGMVCLWTWSRPRSILSYLFCRYSRRHKSFLLEWASFF